MPAVIEGAGPGVFRVRGIVLSNSSRTPVPNTRVLVSASDILGEDVASGLYAEPQGASPVFVTVPVYADPFLRQRIDNVYSRQDGTFDFYVPVGRYRIAYPAGGDFHQPADILFLGEHLSTLVRKNGTNVAMRRNLNFIEGSNVELAIVDDPINDEVDITITGGGGEYEPAGSIATHEADTTAIHGITDTAQIALKNAANAFTQPQQIPLGTAALPGLTPASDPNTGLWSPGADILAWSTNGVERMRLTAAGQLQLPTQGSAGGLLIGGDSGFYRHAAAVFRSSGIQQQAATGFFSSFIGGSYVMYGAGSPNNLMTAANAAHIPLVIKGLAGQTAVLQQWQDSAGTSLAHVQPDGSLYLNYGGPANGRIVFGTDTSLYRLSAGVVATGGDVELVTAAKGIILKSPTGIRYRTIVSDIGVLTTLPA